ncbi:GntR family transcriptional regulator [Tardiphaga sp. 866_E4_N2_1]|uniref:GntR family transcriptional regulator n=1 Tax=unclassified Tardiphaga TaxID=2631404 RepID=UPI003F236EC6
MSDQSAQSPDRTATRSLSVADRIRSFILEGDFEPGARLQEVRLSEMLGVSRTPIRAALQSLAADGLLEYAPNCGYSVRSFQAPEIIDAYEIRANLEAMAARFAAERGLSDEERDVIEQALADGDELLAKEPLGETERKVYGAINFIIHETIHKAARCRMLVEMIRLCQIVPQSSLHYIVAFEHMDVRRRHDDHHRIYDAILTRDAHRSELLMREHVATVKTSLVRSMTRRRNGKDRSNIPS